MSRIQEAFQGKKAFIPFITCGDPDLETTEQLVYAMEKEGAAVIELGIHRAGDPVLGSHGRRAGHTGGKPAGAWRRCDHG